MSPLAVRGPWSCGALRHCASLVNGNANASSAATGAAIEDLRPGTRGIEPEPTSVPWSSQRRLELPTAMPTRWIGETTMGRRRVLLSSLAALLAASAPAVAHHSFSAIFDAKKPVTLTGTVTRIEWMNPHTWVYLDVKKDDGR